MELRIPPRHINMPSDIRTVNEMRVLGQFRSGDKITAADIQSATGISKPTIMKILQHMCVQGLIRPAGTGSSTSAGGKKPELYVFADERKILSVSFWPHKTTLALAGIVGDVFALETVEHELGSDLDAEILWLQQTIRNYLKKTGFSMTSLFGAVISTSGTVDYYRSILRYNSQAPAWGSNVHLKEYLEEHFGASELYAVENAGKAAGRGLLVNNPELNDKSVLSLFTTWGVSACLMEHGRVLNGKDFLIGEIGHMTVSDTYAELCGCGRRGCLEQIVSMANVRRMAKELEAPWFREEAEFSFEELFSLSRDGDACARTIVKRLAHWFAIALHNVMLIYNPDTVIFQGNFAYADACFDNCLRTELNTFRYLLGESVQICYDRTPLELQAAKGGVDMLRRVFFSSPQSEFGIDR